MDTLGLSEFHYPPCACDVCLVTRTPLVYSLKLIRSLSMRHTYVWCMYVLRGVCSGNHMTMASISTTCRRIECVCILASVGVGVC